MSRNGCIKNPTNKGSHTEDRAIVMWPHLNGLNIRQILRIWYHFKKHTNKPRYALVVIEIFSKLGEALPLHNKDSISVYNDLLFLGGEKGDPISIYSDDDGAFRSKVKALFDGEGINNIVTSTHANVAERWIRTLQNAIHDRVRFTKGRWEGMLKIVVNKYNNTINSSTKLKPKDAHDDKNSPGVAIQLTVNSMNQTKYQNINAGDEVKIYDNGQGNYANRKETTSKQSDTTYKIEKVDRDITLNKYYVLEGTNRHYNQNEMLLIQGNDAHADRTHHC